jgi:hypothetical protein
MTRGTFAARIRWRSSVTPSLEVDTVHRAFATAEMAALFANGLGPEAVEGLSLERGILELELTDGRRIVIDSAELSIWTKAEGAQSLPDVAGFERSDWTPDVLSREGHDGRFDAREFRIVTDSTPEHDVDVRLQVDLRRDVLRVAVGGSRPRMDESHAEGATVFAVIPKA